MCHSKSFIIIFLLIFTFSCVKAERTLSRNDCQCGVFTEKYYGDTRAAFSWVLYIHVNVNDNPVRTCVGTVIASNIVLGSTECLTNWEVAASDNSITVTLSDSRDLGQGRIFPVDDIIELGASTKIVGIKVDYDFTSTESENKPVCIPTQDELRGPSLPGRLVRFHSSSSNTILINSLEVIEGSYCNSEVNDLLGLAGLQGVYCVNIYDRDVNLESGQPLFLEVKKNPLSDWAVHGLYFYLVGITTLVWKDGYGGRQVYFIPANSALDLIESFADTDPGTRWCPQPWAWLKAPERIRRDKSLNCECGLRQRDRGRIIGGQDAIPYEFPWQVQISLSKPGSPYVYYCGGTIISDRTILTAGHCVTDLDGVYTSEGYDDVVKPSYVFRLTFNSHSGFGGSDRNEIKRRGRIVLAHPGYADSIRRNNKVNLEMDVALVILDNPLDLTIRSNGQPVLRPICLPEYGEKIDLEWREGIVAGYGLIHRDEHDLADVLQKVKVTFLPLDLCKEKFRNRTGRPYYHRSVICGGVDWDKNVDHGDSGGPGIIETSPGKYTQVVVTSYSDDFYDNDGYGANPIGKAFFYADLQDKNLLSWVDYQVDMSGGKYCRR